MRHMVTYRALVFCLLSFAAPIGAESLLPKRDFTIEVRQIEEGREAGESYRAGTHSQTQWVTQSLNVRNGEKGSLKGQRSLPMQWVQSVQSQSTGIAGPSAAASSTSAATTQTLQWFDVGQNLVVSPKWPGGRKDLALEIELERFDMVDSTHADLPGQSRRRVSTTVTLPLNQWVTIAATGKSAAPAGSYSSESSTEARRLLQVRVLAP
ncbi:MAG: hypothetical protein CFE44_05090 [Burkholderiales bacterium PBB4]|nr:MAG: hypothetical protein CFE44_05090 [Burkholderiales bacterium PBB4]